MSSGRALPQKQLLGVGISRHEQIIIAAVGLPFSLGFVMLCARSFRKTSHKTGRFPPAAKGGLKCPRAIPSKGR